MSQLLSPQLLSMGNSLYFHCPGCDMLHPYRIKNDGTGPVWAWDHNVTSPTISPSLLVDKDRPESRCHLFLIDGKIKFLEDCHHELKGQTVDMVDIPDLDVWLD